MTVSPVSPVSNNYYDYSNYAKQVQSPYGYQPYQKPVPEKVVELPDRYVETYKTEASKGKKWGVGIASAFISGLGQAINGEWGKALAFFGGSILASTVFPIAVLPIGIWSIVDAVKHASSTQEVIIPKKENNSDNQKLDIVA